MCLTVTRCLGPVLPCFGLGEMRKRERCACDWIQYGRSGNPPSNLPTKCSQPPGRRGAFPGWSIPSRWSLQARKWMCQAPDSVQEGMLPPRTRPPGLTIQWERQICERVEDWSNSAWKPQKAVTALIARLKLKMIKDQKRNCVVLAPT